MYVPAVAPKGNPGKLGTWVATPALPPGATHLPLRRVRVYGVATAPSRRPPLAVCLPARHCRSLRESSYEPWADLLLLFPAQTVLYLRMISSLSRPQTPLPPSSPKRTQNPNPHIPNEAESTPVLRPRRSPLRWPRPHLCPHGLSQNPSFPNEPIVPRNTLLFSSLDTLRPAGGHVRRWCRPPRLTRSHTTRSISRNSLMCGWSDFSRPAVEPK